MRNEVTYLPVRAARHVAVLQMTVHRSWWALFRAWTRGARRVRG